MKTVDLLSRLEELVDGKRYERYIACCCIFHDDAKPSMFVYEDSYRCVGCGAFGTTASLLRHLSGETITKHIHTEKTWTTNPFSKWTKDHSLGFILRESYQYLQDHIYFGSYLIGRGISEALIKELKIGYRDGYFTFPIIHDHKVVGAFARSGSSGKQYFLPKGQDPNLLYVPSEKLLQSCNRIFLTFGAIDSISIYSLGLPAASTTTGKRLSVEALDSYRKEIIIVPDYGEEKEARKLVMQLGWRGSVKRLSYPDGSKDPNDLLRHHPDLLRQELAV